MYRWMFCAVGYPAESASYLLEVYILPSSTVMTKDFFRLKFPTGEKLLFRTAVVELGNLSENVSLAIIPSLFGKLFHL